MALNGDELARLRERAAEVHWRAWSLNAANTEGWGDQQAHNRGMSDAVVDAVLAALSRMDHDCDTGNFDRTLCPEPCGAMHSYCATCGKRQDPCRHDHRQDDGERSGQ